MQQFDFYIGYPVPTTLVLFPPPFNWQELQHELSFENLSPEAVLNATKLIWKGETAGIMNTWVHNGLSGGVGIFEGIPLQIKVCGTQQLVFDGIIDLTDSETTFTCDIVQVKIRDKRMDMVSQLMESISFAYLASLPAGAPGKITPGNKLAGQGDYLPIAYQRNDIPSYESTMTLILSMWSMYQIGEEIVDSIVNGEEAVEAAVAAGLAFDFASMAVQIVIAGFYTVITIALTLIELALFKACLNCMIAPVLTKYGMYAKDLIQKACDYFGLQFSSTIFSDPDYSRLVIMPVKGAYVRNLTFTQYFDQLGNATGLTEYDDLYNLSHGNFAYGYYDGTPGQFIRSMEDVFNAKAKIIINNLGQPVLHFERWDFQYNLANYSLPNISDQVPFNSNGLFNNSGQSRSAFGTNANEIQANYELRYALDSSDRNTYDYYEGTACMCNTAPITVTAGLQRNVLLQHLKQVNFEYAQAKRKDKTTMIEDVFSNAISFLNSIFSGLDQVVNNVIAVTSSGVSYLISQGTSVPVPLSSPFGSLGLTSLSSFNQIGHLHLSNDTTGIPKMFIAGPPQAYNPLSLSNWNGRNFTAITVDPNNRNIIGTRQLFKNFHFSNLAKTVTPPAPYNQPYSPSATYYNQWLEYKNQRIPLCCEDYELIKENNIIKTFDGQFARVDSLKWNPFKGEALIDYRIQQPYTQNLKTTFIIDGVTVTPTL